MARINLLPWRQEERLRKNKEFNLTAIGVAVVTALALLLALTFLNNMLSDQESANAMIEAENARLETVNAEIATLEEQRENMLSRMKVVQDLQGRRSVPVRVWDDIARAIPPNMYLMSMTRTDDVITITGMADNANVVSQFIRNLDNSVWLGGSAIPNISSNPTPTNQDPNRPVYPEDRYISFTVVTNITSAQEQEAAQEAEQATLAQGLPAQANQPVATPPTTTTQAVVAPANTVVVDVPTSDGTTAVAVVPGQAGATVVTNQTTPPTEPVPTTQVAQPASEPQPTNAPAGGQ